MPCVPYAGPKVGFAFLPEIGSGVWIEFEGGDVSYPIWVGGYWRAGEFPAGAAAAREGDRHQRSRQPGSRRKAVTRAQLNDTQGSITVSTRTATR